METLPNNPIRLIVLSIPLLTWIAAQIYVSQFEGWGAWAAAPILLVPLALSLVLGLYAIGMMLKLPSQQRRSWKSIGSCILPWIPILHVLAQNIARGLQDPTGL